MKRWERERSQWLGVPHGPMVLHCLEGPWLSAGRVGGHRPRGGEEPTDQGALPEGLPCAPEPRGGVRAGAQLRPVASGPPGRRQTAGFGRLRRIILLELQEETSCLPLPCSLGLSTFPTRVTRTCTTPTQRPPR